MMTGKKRKKVVVVCPAFFKGSVSAIEAVESISKGIRAALPDCSIIEIARQLGLVSYNCVKYSWNPGQTL